MFLFLFRNIISVELGPKFSLLTENISVMRQAFASVQHGFPRSAENVYLHNILVLFEKMFFLMILDEVLMNISELELNRSTPSGYTTCHMAITSAILNNRQ